MRLGRQKASYIYRQPFTEPSCSHILREANTYLAEAAAQLDDYFARRLRRFDLPLMPIGTEFQRRVWDELRRIPYGQTISYKELALRIGNPKAVRAVASANRANPISIIIPCHRVIGSNGRLVGYSGGLDKKETLLQLEQRVDEV